MTIENLKKKYAHFKKLIENEDFRNKFAVSVSDKGETLVTERSQLIKSDAQRHLNSLLKKFPELEEKVEKKPEEVKVEKKGTKSKGKK